MRSWDGPTNNGHIKLTFDIIWFVEKDQQHQIKKTEFDKSKNVNSSDDYPQMCALSLYIYLDMVMVMLMSIMKEVHNHH